MNMAALRAVQCVVCEDDLLSRYTTFQLGGACALLVSCRTPEQLAVTVAELFHAGQEFLVIGGGSNLLVADEGVSGVIVRYFSELPAIRQSGDVVEVVGSTLLDDVAAFTVEAGLGGLTFASGIPGTMGGAIAGNAGAFGRQLGDVVEEVILMDCAGRLRHVSRDALCFSYRGSALQQNREIVVSVRLRLAVADVAELQHQRTEYLFIRRQKHPDWHTLPTAGSFFKNIEPTSTADRRKAAGWFLEQAGVLPMRIRGARPYEKHANIIVRDGDCTAQDVLDLSRQMAAAVEKQFGLRLEREVCLLGRFR